MKEKIKKETMQFNIVVPVEWVERFKKIQEREGCLNYNAVFIGLIEQYEEIAREWDKKNATK